MFTCTTSEFVPTKSPFRFTDLVGDLVIKKIANLSEGDKPLLIDALLSEDILRIYIEDEQDLDFLVDLLKQHKRIEILYINCSTSDAFINQLPQALQTANFVELQLSPKKNFDPILRVLKHHKTLRSFRLNLNFRPDNHDSIADAIANDNLEVFEMFSYPTLSEQESFWSSLIPVLSYHKSLKTIIIEISYSTAFQAFGEILAKNTTIQQLELKSLQGESSATDTSMLCNGLINNSTLQYLCVDRLGDGAANILFALLANARCSVPGIQVDITTLTEEDVALLSESLKTNTTLTDLVLHECSLGDKISVLCEGLKHNKSLKYLGLMMEFMTHTKAVTAICDMLTFNDTLTTLDLTNCSITNEQCHVIGRMLMENKSLTDFTVSTYGLDDDGIITICEAISQNTTLKKFQLGPGEGEIRAMTAVKNLLERNHTLRHLKVALTVYADTSPAIDALCEGIQRNHGVVNLQLDLWHFSDPIQKFVDALQDNYALDNFTLDVINDKKCPLKAASRPILHRNRQLKSAIKFKVAILSHNIARSDHALTILPREIWQLILSLITSPGMEPFNDFVTTIFNSYE